MSYIYRITTKTVWKDAQAAGVFSDASLSSEGFIHFSYEHQVARTVERFYKDQMDLVVLTIDTKKLTAPLVEEDTSGHGMFPHLYGPLNLDAVVEIRESRELLGWLNSKK
jgi:uncharacterized protein (DUF952 family)